MNFQTFQENIDAKTPGLFSECITSYNQTDVSEDQAPTTISSYDIDNKNYLCKVCKGSMQKAKMPKICANNVLIKEIGN